MRLALPAELEAATGELEQLEQRDDRRAKPQADRATQIRVELDLLQAHTTRHVDQSHPAVAVNPDDVTHRVSLHFVDPLNVEVSVVDSQVDEVFPASTDNACYDVCVHV